MDTFRAYVFGDAQETNALCVKADHLAAGNEDLFAGKWCPAEPIMFLPHLGRVPKDLITGSALWTKLISKKLRDLLIMHELSGWRTYPVELYGADGKLVRSYHGLSITGRCGAIDDARSRIAEEDVFGIGKTQAVKIGLFFPPESWDGSDLFLAGERGFMFCSERAAEVFRKAKLSNVRVTRASDFRRLFFPQSNATAS